MYVHRPRPVDRLVLPFRLRRLDALERSICVRCEAAVDALRLAWEDLAEYGISGLCPSCWDDLTAGCE